ncbi:MULTISPECIES: response regulator transcription factor [unclassified Vibrio]|uniref:response regulator transcription factor n=1 Tax=unclassified Vibrio TaxID=2614977 RepID=UPI00159E4D81|nr:MULTISPECIES: response regulator transcription factor [unclassified Vibrio]NVN80202.1 response regulator transcription factor [Vibrio sp. Scap16]QLE95978.1 response regulator transcription factor [Vibrio sp. Scap24]
MTVNQFATILSRDLNYSHKLISQLRDIDIFNLEKFGVVSDMERVLFIKSDILILDFNVLFTMSNEEQKIINLLKQKIIVVNVPIGLICEELMRRRQLRAVLNNGTSISQLSGVILRVGNGGMWFPIEWMEKIIDKYRALSLSYDNTIQYLTHREKQILKKLAEGYSNQSIADKLFITESTVKTHVHKIYQKLGVHNRNEAILFASHN